MKQDLFAKLPSGYRKATPEESQKIMETGMMLRLTQSETARCRAELESAQLRLQKALSESALAGNQQADLMRRLKLQGKLGDIHGTDNGAIILEDESKRLEVWPPPPAPPQVKRAKADLKAIKDPSESSDKTKGTK